MRAPGNQNCGAVHAVTSQQIEISRGSHEILTGSYRCVGKLPQIAKSVDGLCIHFKPRKPGASQLARELRERRRAKVVVQIHGDACFSVEPLAKGIHPFAKIFRDFR